MAHRDSVADGYCIKLERHAASLAHRLLDNLRHLVEMNVAGNDFTKAVRYGDKWLVDIGIGYAAGVQKPPVGCPLKTALYFVASHYVILSVKNAARTRLFSGRIL
jgi:hypothetical protein